MQELQKEAGIIFTDDQSLDAQHDPMQVELPDVDPEWVNEDEDDPLPPEQVEIVHALRDLRLVL